MKRKTTVYLEDGLLRAVKVAAARTGQREYQVVEQALRAYLGLELLERVGPGLSWAKKTPWLWPMANCTGAEAAKCTAWFLIPSS